MDSLPLFSILVTKGPVITRKCGQGDSLLINNCEIYQGPTMYQALFFSTWNIPGSKTKISVLLELRWLCYSVISDKMELKA